MNFLARNRMWFTSILMVCLALVLSSCGGGSEGDTSALQPMFQGELTPEQVNIVLQKSAEINTNELQAEEAATATGVMLAQKAMPKAGTRVTVYRFYNTQTAAHFYTTSETEKANVIANLKQFAYEGPAFYGNGASGNGLSPVYRFYNTQTGVHFYTISAEEKAHIELNLKQFNYEGISYYASKTSGEGLVGLFRFYVPSKGFHFYTASETERDKVISTNANYKFEGLGYYVFASGEVVANGNVVNATVSDGVVAVTREGTTGTNSVQSNAGGGVLLSTSDASVANATVGGIVHIPAAAGGLELPFTGRVASVTTASGKQQIQLVPANPEDVFNEISWDIDTRRGGTKVAGVIAPKSAVASFSLAQRAVSPGAAGSQRKLAVDGSFTAANSMLNGTVTVTQPIVYKGATITLTATANISDVALRSEAVFSKNIPDYFSTAGWGKITAVVSGKVGGQVKLEGAANDIKLADMLTSTDVWDQLKWNGGGIVSLEGLDGQDKAGRIPLGGVILTSGAATAFKGNIPDSAITFLSAAPTSVLWIYLNLDGTLSLQGETGWRAADYGFEQGVEARLVGSVLLPTLINNSTPGWQELYAKGSATYTQRVGLMPAADVLIAGIRPAHINAFVGAEFNGSMNGAGEYRFLPTPRTANGAFCMQSHAWAGIELNTRFRVKAKLETFAFKTSVGVEEQQYTGRPVTWVDEDLQPLCVTGGAFSISAVARGPDPANSAKALVDIDFTPAYNNTSIRSLTDIWRVTASCAGCTNAVFDIPAAKAGLDRISLPFGKTYTLTLAALSNTYQVIKTATTSVTLGSAPSASFVVAANAGNCASLKLTATAAASSGRTISSYAWQVQRTGAAAQSFNGNPVNSVALPSCGTTQIQLTVTDSQGFTTLVSQTVDTSNLGAKVTNVTPLTAILDVPTAFTVTGTNLPLTAQLVLGSFAECQPPVNSTSTGFQQTCTPRGTTGSKVLTIMTNLVVNGGVLVDASRSVVVTLCPAGQVAQGGACVAATSVTSISPLTAVLDAPTVFTVAGTNLPLTTQLVLGTFAECQPPVASTSSGFQQTCTPRGTAGSKVLTVMTNSVANGGVLIDSSRSVAVTTAPVGKYSLVGNYSKEECVKDNTTGLIWEGKAASGARAGNNLYTNYDAAYSGTQLQVIASDNTFGYLGYINAGALCGFSDWRLPTSDELIGLLDYNRNEAPRVDINWFPNTPSNLFWSSSPVVDVPGSARFVSYGFPVLVAYNPRGIYSAVRLVR